MMTFVTLGEVKATKIERLKDCWEITVSAVVGGVPFSGMYEVYPESINERWFEPSDGSVRADLDDDDFLVCRSAVEVFWRVDGDVFLDVSKDAENAAGKFADDLESEIAEFARGRISELVA